MVVAHDSRYALWEVLGSLWDRATGGADVAARPDKKVDEVWPSATRPPGVSAALSWLSSKSPSAIPRILLLVGGPGAGKSHATSTAVEGMTRTSTVERGLAQRTYEYTDGSRNLLVVNDATISDTRHGTPLVADIDGALAGDLREGLRTDVMACINRGILIEELSQLPSDEESAGALVVSWLTHDRLRLGAFTLDSSVRLPYGRSAELKYGGSPLAHVVVVFVDECSLFEASPTMSIVDNELREVSGYRIRRLADRTGLLAEDGQVPAADLLDAVVASIDSRLETMDEVVDIQADPLAGNFESLKSAGVRSSLLTLARSAELAGSTRMTYRELWGFIARVLVGAAPDWLSRHQLAGFILQNQPKRMNRLEDFEALRRLSALRFTQGIFGAGAESLASARAGNDPVLRLTIAIDPILDALPGTSPYNPRAGWADPIHEAFASQSMTITPLTALIASTAGDEVPEGAAKFSEIVSEFDWQVDAAFAALVSNETLPDNDRLQASSWYGAYLTRLYAVALGIPAFRREIDALIEAIVATPKLPDVLRKPMETLLRPKRQLRDGESEALLPLFDSRTEPIVGHLIEPKMALRVEDGKLGTKRGGSDEVFLELRREGELQGRINVDFALVREALACVDDHSGVTNLVDVTAPRLERVRSSRLRSKLLDGAELRIASGVESHLVTFSSY